MSSEEIKKENAEMRNEMRRIGYTNIYSDVDDSEENITQNNKKMKELLGY